MRHNVDGRVQVRTVDSHAGLGLTEGNQLFIKLLNAVDLSVHVVQNSAAASVGAVNDTAKTDILYVKAVRRVGDQV